MKDGPTALEVDRRGSRAAGALLVAAVALELVSIGASIASAIAVWVEQPNPHWISLAFAPGTLLRAQLGHSAIWWGSLPFVAAGLFALSFAGTAFARGDTRLRALAVPAIVVGALLASWHGITTLACVAWSATEPHSFML